MRQGGPTAPAIRRSRVPWPLCPVLPRTRNQGRPRGLVLRAGQEAPGRQGANAAFSLVPRVQRNGAFREDLPPARRGVPVKRGKPLARKTPLRRSRMKRKATKPRKGADPAHLQLVRNLPCVLTSVGDCYGRVHAHHAGPRPGTGLKASDDTAIPLCAKHHEEWHGASGFFRRFDRDLRRHWSDKQIDDTRSLVRAETQDETRGERP